MLCKSIKYTDFRNISSEEIEFSPTTTILYGKNAQGKTNMLEGVYLFAQGKSHRAGKESELIRFGAEVARLEMVYESGGREHKLSLVLDGKRKACYKNGIKLDKLSEMIGSFRAVMFCPEHLFIVKGGPSERRSFLDIAISQLRPVYLKTLQRYNLILMQRNALLKSAKGSGSAPALEAWSEQLAEYSAFIAKTRYEYTEKLSKIASALYSDMTGGAEELELHYRSTSRLGGNYTDVNYMKQVYLRQLTENTEREILLGSTQYGIHKDDMEIVLNGKDARFFASQGQQRSIVLSMKLAEGEYSKNETGEYPVLLLDDILSELDPSRRAYVISGIRERQVIITSCDTSVSRRMRDGKRYHIKGGECV